MGKGPKPPKPTAGENATAKVNVEGWNEYATKWHEPILTWAKGVAADKTPEMRRATAITNADLAQQSTGVEKAVAGGGMSPNSGRAFGAVSDASTLTGTAGAGAAVKARQGVEDARLAGMQQVAAIGSGQKTSAVQGLQEIARDSVNSSIAEAMDKQQGRSDRAGMVAGTAGVAAGVYKGMRGGGQWAGTMNDFDAEGQAAVIAGASKGSGGYQVDRYGNVSWN